MSARFIKIVACALLLASVFAHAQDRNRYRWHDADGGLHYGDVLPADAGKYGYDVLSPQGILVKHVDRAKTPAERKAEAARSEKAEQARAASERQDRSDRQLLAAYPTEEDLLRDQRVERELLDQELDSLRAELNSSEQLLSDQLDAAANYEQRKQAVPGNLAGQITELRTRIVDQRRYLERKHEARGAAEARQAQELSRYRGLRSESPNSN